MAVFLASAGSNAVLATHIRAGDIVARSVGGTQNPLLFEFTLVIFTDPGTMVSTEFATLYFGDGEADTVTWVPGGYTEVTPNTWRNEYRFIHQYNAPGYYAVQFNAENRNAGILNMSQSVSTSFYLQTEVFINPLAGPNMTPRLGVPPLDKALRGQIFEHHPQAYDVEGDSLSYRLIVPRMSLPSNPPVPTPVANYTSPADPVHEGQSLTGGEAFFVIDELTGLITWNTPGRLGEYNIAFVVEEWRLIRQGEPRVKMSVTTRDMQILVEGDENRPPKLTIPKDLCVVPGTFTHPDAVFTGDIIQDTISVTDPDGHSVHVELFSPLPANVIYLPPTTSPPPVPGARITFRQLTDTTYLFIWDMPLCSDVRQMPYDFVFKATDNPPGDIQELIDFETWRIKVVGPEITNVTATPVNKTIALTWDPYHCQNGEIINIYRRIEPVPFIPDSCQLGVPQSTGYVKIAEVPVSATSYTDTNNGEDLEFCTNYSYILSVDFPLPGAGESYASNEAFTDLLFEIPVMTKVSVETTSTTTGEISVAWQAPPEFVRSLLRQYRMKLFRATGATPGAYSEIHTVLNAFGNTAADSTFTDTGLNTQDEIYHYKVGLFESTDEIGTEFALVAESEPASSVRLAGASGIRNIALTWTYAVPWNNTGNYHYIYRQIDGDYTLIDSVFITGESGAYTDSGQHNNTPLIEKRTYCYYVTTQGDYTCNPAEPLKLLNNSQRLCVFLEDRTSPCDLVLSIDSVNCETFDLQPPYTNRLRWKFAANPPGCDTTDVAFYTLYYTPSSVTPIDSFRQVKEQFYNHGPLISLAGCYAVSATDSTGNTSALSEQVCVDNCIYIMLPNIITPNNDNVNDYFVPSSKSRFIKSFKVTIFNRWGGVVFENTKADEPWNGKDKSGRKVPRGIYYYLAEVEFYTFNPNDSMKTYKGWLEVVE